MRILGGRSGAEGRERESKVLLEGWKRGRRVGYTNRGRRKGGRPGERARLGKIEESSNSHGKKKGGRKGGRTERRCVWKIWPEPRQKRNPGGWLEKRRCVTVTVDDGLNQNREAQDEASRIGTKPSGVMTR